MTNTAADSQSPAFGHQNGELRVRAGRIVLSVADRLSSPRHVAGIRSAPARPAGASPQPRSWSPWLLTEGHPGVALLFAHLGRSDKEMRHRAHAHLAAATDATAPDVRQGVSLYGGLVSLGFAARVAVSSPADYQTLLTRVNEHVRANGHAVLQFEQSRLDAHRPGTRPRYYDLTTGLTGTGRYLLASMDASGPADYDGAVHGTLAEILRYLVRITEPVVIGHDRAPGWWTSQTLHEQDSVGPGGRLYLGMAHGIAGPLTLLAVASRSGFTVAGQDHAIDRIAEWLLSWRLFDDSGPYWPTSVSLADDATRPAGRAYPSRAASWCYGTPGIARALQLAGHARQQPEWGRAATEAMRAVFRRPPGQQRFFDTAICHGYSGLLHATRRIAQDSADAELLDRVPHLVLDILGQYDADAPFGFRYQTAPDSGRTDSDLAGFLDGAAGTALALADYSHQTGPTPPSASLSCPWDAALLLS